MTRASWARCARCGDMRQSRFLCPGQCIAGSWRFCSMSDQVSAKDYFRPQEPGPFNYLGDEDSVEWLVQDLSFGSLLETIRAVNAEVREHGRQGATDQELRDAMAMCVVEEAGEFIGEYRRLRGFARRAGNREQMLSELA